MIVFVFLIFQVFLVSDSLKLSSINLKCIKQKDNYCLKKLHNFRFNNGCKMCRCRNGKSICSKVKCQSHVKNIFHLLNYCQEIVKKNEQDYKKYLLLKLYAENKGQKSKGNHYGRHKKRNWRHNRYHRRSREDSDFHHLKIKRDDFQKRFDFKGNHYVYAQRILILRRRLKITKLKNLKLQLKKKRILKKFKRIRNHYYASKRSHSHSLKTRFWKYRMNHFKKHLRNIIRRIKNLDKESKFIKKEIRRCLKILKLYKNNYRKKLENMRVNFKEKIKNLKRLKTLYVNEKKRYEKLIRKKSYLNRKKNSKIKKTNAILKEKLNKIKIQIEREKQHMEKIKKKFLKYEGRKIKLNDQTGRSQKNNSKRDNFKKKLLIKEIKIKNQVDDSLSGRIKTKTHGSKKIRHKSSTHSDIHKILKNTTKNSNRPAKLMEKESDDLLKNLAYNKQISQKLIDIKNFFKRHLSESSKLDTRDFNRKIQLILPLLAHLNTTNNITSDNYVKRYLIKNKNLIMNPIQLNHLRKINNNLYKKYLKLIRLRLVEKKLHQTFKDGRLHLDEELEDFEREQNRRSKHRQRKRRRKHGKRKGHSHYRRKKAAVMKSFSIFLIVNLSLVGTLIHF